VPKIFFWVWDVGVSNNFFECARPLSLKGFSKTVCLWWVLQHCTGFARLVWGRLRVHLSFHLFKSSGVFCVFLFSSYSGFHWEVCHSTRRIGPMTLHMSSPSLYRKDFHRLAQGMDTRWVSTAHYATLYEWVVPHDTLCTMTPLIMTLPCMTLLTTHYATLYERVVPHVWFNPWT